MGSADNVEAPFPIVTAFGVDYQLSVGSSGPSFPNSFSLENIVVNNMNADVNNVQDDGITGYRPEVAGKPVLIRFGTGGGSAARCNAAFDANATACIIYSDTDATIGIAGANRIPSAYIAKAAGKLEASNIRSCNY